MDAGLRRAWTEIVTADDYESHMLAVGQARAAAELTRWLIVSAACRPGDRITFAGAGTGQMLDFLEAELLRPYRLTFSDLNPAFLERLRERLARGGLDAETVADDIENTALAPGAALLIATLLLEHVDWRRGAEVLAALRPAACGIILQENPPDMTAAVTPGRRIPPSLARAVEIGTPTLVPREEFVALMNRLGYACLETGFREVADGKRLVALRLMPSTGLEGSPTAR
jgi:hypothetical protein